MSYRIYRGGIIRLIVVLPPIKMGAQKPFGEMIFKHPYCVYSLALPLLPLR